MGSTLQDTQFIPGASATKWKHQAFQLLGLPVWGVQFHPNWPVEGSEIIFNILKLHNPDAVIERQGSIDENERHCMARGYLYACRQHVALRLLLSI